MGRTIRSGPGQRSLSGLMIDDQRKMIGSQFHPEYATDEHPAGRRLIANFMDWSGIR